MRVQHFDRISVRWDASTMRTGVDSSRTIDGVGARVGNMTYHDDKGRPFIEHVPASTLFHPDSLESAVGQTLTIRHGPGLVTPDRYRAEAHGAWVKAWDAGDGNLGVRVRLKSQDAIDFVDKAIAADESVELSPVYEVDVVDTPGDTEHGHHDAVQRGVRDYSAIAILGQDEARGGPGVRLQLDGPECAPQGTRVQVLRKLDSAGKPRLSFVAKDSTPMTKAIISCKGRRRTISLDALSGLRTVTAADQIETGRVTIEIEGEETSELVLPTSMIEMLLEGIGASSAPTPEAPPVEEEVAMEAIDAEDEDKKMDAKIKGAIAAAFLQRDAIGNRRTSVNADAAKVLPAEYDYSVTWTQVALDAIAKIDPDAELLARKLAKLAQSDAVAEGRLRQMLSMMVAASPVKVIEGGGLHTTKPKHADSGDEPWASASMPKREAN